MASILKSKSTRQIIEMLILVFLLSPVPVGHCHGDCSLGFIVPSATTKTKGNLYRPQVETKPSTDVDVFDEASIGNVIGIGRVVHGKRDSGYGLWCRVCSETGRGRHCDPDGATAKRIAEISIEMTKAMERTLLEFPQVETLVSKTGRPEIANDPMGVYQTDIFVRLDPHAQYAKGQTKKDLVEQMKESLETKVPGNSYSVTQPIELRVQELVAGVRSDLGLSLYGDDLEVLNSRAMSWCGLSSLRGSTSLSTPSSFAAAITREHRAVIATEDRRCPRASNPNIAGCRHRDRGRSG